MEILLTVCVYGCVFVCVTVNCSLSSRAFTHTYTQNENITCKIKVFPCFGKKKSKHRLKLKLTLNQLKNIKRIRQLFFISAEGTQGLSANFFPPTTVFKDPSLNSSAAQKDLS